MTGKGRKAARAAERSVDRVEEADVAVTRAAASYRDHPLVKTVATLGEVADQPPMLILSATVGLGGAAAGNARLARAGARMFVAVLVAMAAKTVIKRAVDRTRPHLLVEEGRYRLAKGTSTDDGEINSFPSGHTADAVAASRAFARDYPASAPAGAAAALTVAAIQIPRCQHFLSDIGAGALIGVAADAAADRIVRAGEARLRAAGMFEAKVDGG